MWGRQFDKATLVKMYLEQGGTIDEILNKSFSCHTPKNNERCWNCISCFKTYCALAYNGWKPSEEITKKIVEFIEREVIPNPICVLGKQDETEAILKVISEFGYEQKGDKIVKVS